MRYIRYLKKPSCPFPLACKNMLKTCPLRQVGLLPKASASMKVESNKEEHKPEISKHFYNEKFKNSIEGLKKEGRYREFISIKRQAGKYPIALNLHKVQKAEDITVWCSNDYLGSFNFIRFYYLFLKKEWPKIQKLYRLLSKP